jgi:hypothetical protein
VPQGLEEVRAALEAEQARAVRLEVELAEARRQLARMEELERELTKYRWAAWHSHAAWSPQGCLK